MDYYSTLAPGYNELHREEQLAKLRIISQHLNVKEDKKLLDVGCGTGFSQEIFNCRIFGIEPSREMLIQGRKDEEHQMDFVEGVGEHLPFKDNTFDTIICVTALHNFENPEKGLLEMARVGRNRGAITILKKAKRAEELKELVKRIFQIQLEVEEEKDHILLFGLSKS
jgi:demethylmenaquinone methyltransferase/2-methoxy-6-polyprenyl-1,4-benzoquinol methylase